jgi:exopolysaccharide biosynthesis polyprenyl glycosylphosphotransferase
MLKSKLKQITLLLGDIAFFYLALYIALYLRYLKHPNSQLWLQNSRAFLGVFLIWILAFYIGSLYDLKRFAHRGRFLESYLKSLVIALTLSVVFFYLSPHQNISPKTNLVIFAGVFSILFLSWRFLFAYLLKNRLPKNNLAFIGYHPHLLELINEFKNNPHMGFDPKFIVLGIGEQADPRLRGLLEIFDENDNLEELTSKHKINNIVLAKNINADSSLQRQLFNCLPLGISYTTLPSFYEKITGRIPLEIIGQAWFLENLDLADKKFFEYTKRLVDILISVFGLILTSPLWPLIALSIKLNSAGPIFFTQIRLGRNNIPFKMYKFRTMKTTNNQQTMTVKNDSRITWSGRILRQTRIDELPQLFNIIKGQMSFVGPRPERPELVVELKQQVDFFDIRTLVKPGITGWDQISGEYHSPLPLDTFKKLQHDLFYIKNRSIYLDVTILLKTIKTIITYQGR